MRRIAAAALLALLALAAGTAEARQHFPARGHRILPAVSPLDAFTQPSGAHSFRKLKSTYAGPAVRLRRASDNAEVDINFLGCTGFTGCPWDEATAAAHCAATTCDIQTWYDQSGNGRHLVRGGATGPAYTAGCLSLLPCMQLTTTSTNDLVGPNIAWSVKSTFSAVASRVSGTGACVFLRKGTNQLVGMTGVANQWQVSDGVASAFTMVASDAAWHAGIGIIDGAASLGRIDATEMAGTTVAGNAAAGFLRSGGITGSTCRQAELILWDGYALTLAERQALTANQKSFWGTP
jgi:hypothetical protein